STFVMILSMMAMQKGIPGGECLMQGQSHRYNQRAVTNWALEKSDAPVAWRRSVLAQSAAPVADSQDH
ncbi:MAG TPA: hypothetical protein V6C72_05475, partial [Chroococcales cyanobacterium]